MDLLGTLLLFAVIIIFSVILIGKLPDPVRNHYQKKDRFLTAAEHSFYKVLMQSVGNNYVVFAQVRVADVITPKKKINKQKWWKRFVKISSKHYDFVLCEPSNLKIMGAIELDDRSHEKKERKKRDLFLNAASEGANLILLRIPVKKTYSVNDIKEKLKTLQRG